MSTPAQDRPAAPPSGGRHLPAPSLLLVAALLAAPLVALLWVSSYAKEEPRLFGFPFFYWYQFAWVFITAATTSIAFRIVQRHERRRRADRTTSDVGGRR